MTRIGTDITRRALLAGAVAAAASSGSALAQEQPQTGPGSRVVMARMQASFGGQTFTLSLYDNPSARDIAAMLPLELTIEDYSTNEKIAYLPRKLTEAASGAFSGEAPGDLCYYAPWGNLAFFHAGYVWSRGLIRLGRLDDGVAPLLRRGTFPLRLERLS